MKRKKCSKCGKIKNIIDFYKNKITKDGLQAICKKCHREYLKKYRQENKKEIEDYRLKYQYGITLEERDSLLKKQNYKCAICGKPERENKRKLSIDHNHHTSYIRGLLCNYCNGRLLKYLCDNKDRAIGLVNYLQQALKNDTAWELKRKYG